MKVYRLYCLVGALMAVLSLRAQVQKGNIRFSDELTRSLCVDAWDINGDGQLSYVEAAAVTDIGTVFKGTGITSFDELRFFTSVTEIPTEAFRGCPNLKSLQLPESVTQIGSYAFHTCRIMTDITLNEGLQTISSGAFIACLSLKEITLPSTVTTLGSNAFYQCSALLEITLPEGITSLPGGLFNGCTSLSKVTVPNSVVSMSNSTFSGCSSLTEVTMPVVLPASYLPQSVQLLHLVYRPTAEYTMLSSPNRLDFGQMEDITVYVVPSYSSRHVELQEVTDVAAGSGMLVHAQPGHQYEVLLGTIGEYAPEQQNAHLAPQRWHGDPVSKDLSEANGGHGELYTGPNFLVGTASSATIPGLHSSQQNFLLQQKDGRYLFTAVSTSAVVDAHSAYLQLPYEDVVGMNELSLPFDSIHEEDILFFADMEVKRVCVEAWDTDGDGELSFDEAAAVKNLRTYFKDNKNIKVFNELKYFTSLTQIGEEAFYGCSSLTSVMLPSTIRTIGASAFYGCFALAVPQFGDKLTTISSNAFTSCTSFTEVKLPSTVRTIGTRAFYYCSKLNSIEIPEGVSEIPDRAFASCSALTAIKLPNSVVTLSTTAFNGDHKLATVIMPAHLSASLLPESVQNVRLTIMMNSGFSTFCSPNNLDFSLDENIKAYTANNLRGGNLYFNQMFRMPAGSGMVLHGTKGMEYEVGLDDGTPITDGNLLIGTLEGLTLEPDSLSDFIDLTLKVQGINVSFVPVSNTTNLGPNTAYLRLGREDVSSYTALRANFVNEGNIHFADPIVGQLCVEQWDTDGDGLLSYDEAAAVTDLGQTFKGDTRIRSFMELEYFTGLKHLADSAFTGCQLLSSVMLPSSLTSIGRHAFALCYGITELEVPDSVTSIGNGAFRVCTKLTSFTLPDGAVDLGSRLFDSCSRLVSVHLPERLTAIPSNMFVNCKRLSSIYIPPYVETVEPGAFTGCTSLTSIKKPAILPDTNIPNVEDMQYYYIMKNDWESFSAPNPIDFSHAENAVAYAVDSCNDGVAYLRQLSNTPAGTGVILHGALGVEAIFAKGQSSEPVPNLLIGSVESVEVWPTWVDKSFFLFSATIDGVGFIPVPDTVYTAPHSAYLSLPTVQAGSFEILQMVAEDIIVFADQYVKEICVDIWDTNGDGELSVNEAAQVTDFDVFSSNHDIRYFDEFKHFTGLSSLDVGAFNNCSSLRRITIPANVEEISDFAFDGCYELYNVFFTEGNLRRIGFRAFSSCISLGDIQLPPTVEQIDESAFSYCVALQSFSIPDGVTEIGASTFASCMGLESIYIPCSVKSLHETAFFDCLSLNTVTMPAVLSGNFPFTVKEYKYIHRLEQEYETFCSPYHIIVPKKSGLMAFAAPMCDSHRVMTERVDTITAGMGVLLHGEVGRVYELKAGKQAQPVFNYYVGVLEDTNLYPVINNRYVFVLKNSTNGFGFYRVTQPTMLDACHAYLPLDMSLVGSNDFLEIGILPDIDNPVVYSPRRRGTADALDDQIAAPVTDEWFTLTGVRLQSRPVQPGIYIHNGRKEAVK